MSDTSNALWRRQKAAIRRLFAGADTDGDGQLDKEELQGLLGGTEMFPPEELESLLADVEKLDAAELLKLFRAQKSAATREGKGFTAILKAADAIPEIHEVRKDDIASELLGGYESRTLAGGLEEWEEMREKYSADEPFVDESFEGQSALVSGTGREKEKYITKCKTIENWARVWDLTSQGEQGSLFGSEGVGSQHIAQGSLGDCYFLAAIASAAETPTLVQAAFPGNQEINAAGIYCCRFYRDGEYRYVVVDDRLPLRPSSRPTPKLIFASARKSAYWVPIVEKAWAKLNGSYARISSGNAERTMCEFSHSLKRPITVKLANVREDEAEREELFDKLKGFLADGSLLSASSGSGSDENKNDNGIVLGHAFSILGLYEVDDTEGQELQLIQVRNPWASGEWTGPFSDNDAAWERIPEETRAEMDLTHEDDGAFYMEFKDFCDNFSSVGVARAFPGHDYKILAVCTKATEESGWIEVSSAVGGDCHVTVGPQEARALGDDGSPKMIAGLYVAADAGAKLDNIELTYTVSDTTWEVDLPPGGRLAVRIYVNDKCTTADYSGPCRAFVHIAGPKDMELADTEGFTMEEEEEDEDEVRYETEKKLKGLVRELSEATKWDPQRQSYYVKNMMACGLSAIDVLAALDDETLNDKLAEGEHAAISSKSLQRCEKVACTILKMKGALEALSAEAEWDEEALSELILNLTCANVGSIEDLLQALADEELDDKLRANQLPQPSAPAMAALHNWSVRQKAPDAVYLYGFADDTRIAGRYVKRDEDANGMPTFHNAFVDKYLSCGEDGKWRITKEDGIGGTCCFASTDNNAWDDKAVWTQWSGGEWKTCPDVSACPNDVYLYGLHDGKLSGRYVKSERTINNKPAYRQEPGQYWLCYASNSLWYIQSKKSRGKAVGWVYTTAGDNVAPWDPETKFKEFYDDEWHDCEIRSHPQVLTFYGFERPERCDGQFDLTERTQDDQPVYFNEATDTYLFFTAEKYNWRIQKETDGGLDDWENGHTYAYTLTGPDCFPWDEDVKWKQYKEEWKDAEPKRHPDEVTLTGFQKDNLNGTYTLSEDTACGMPCYQNDRKWLCYVEKYAYWMIQTEDAKNESTTAGYARTHAGEHTAPWLKDCPWKEYYDGEWRDQDISH